MRRILVFSGAVVPMRWIVGTDRKRGGGWKVLVTKDPHGIKTYVFDRILKKGASDALSEMWLDIKSWMDGERFC